ncbi:MAG: hypothetical protein QXP58_09225 [Thermoprotei archaeon]
MAIGDREESCIVEFDGVRELSVALGQLLKLLPFGFNTYPNMVFVFTESVSGLL